MYLYANILHFYTGTTIFDCFIDKKVIISRIIFVKSNGAQNRHPQKQWGAPSKALFCKGLLGAGCLFFILPIGQKAIFITLFCQVGLKIIIFHFSKKQKNTLVDAFRSSTREFPPKFDNDIDFIKKMRNTAF
jgi:hypothetical protein